MGAEEANAPIAIWGYFRRNHAASTVGQIKKWKTLIYIFFDGETWKNIIPTWNWITTELGHKAEKHQQKLHQIIPKNLLNDRGVTPFPIWVWPESFASLANTWAALGKH